MPSYKQRYYGSFCNCASRINNLNRDIRKKKARARGMIDELIAVEVLEYQNKSWLSGSPKKRSEDKMDLLKSIRGEIDSICR